MRKGAYTEAEAEFQKVEEQPSAGIEGALPLDAERELTYDWDTARRQAAR